MQGHGHVGELPQVELELPNPIEKHTADSKWQFCNCKTCQTKRLTLDSLPGKPIDYATYRRKDEKY
jgi:hypothetical protein